MDAKDVLRTPLKPFLDLLDRRVYNLAKLIDAKTAELKQQPHNGADGQVLAGLGDVRQDIAGVDLRVNQQLQGLTRTTLGTQESYLESLSYVGRALREIRDEIGQTPTELNALESQLTGAFERLTAQITELGSQSGLANQVAGVQRDLVALRAMIAASAVTREDIDALRSEMRAMASPATASAPRTGLAEGSLADLDDTSAAFLNYGASHRGFAAQAGLWINQPVQIAHYAGQARVDNVNERILEVPFVFAAIASLPRGARVLDVGGMESTVALSLASLGHPVTVIDPRGYPFPHPSLRVVAMPLEAWDAAPGSFEAIVCLSAVEHIGLGAYGQPPQADDADRTAMRRLRELASPGAVLALTVPFGARAQDAFQRTYDRPALDALVADWQVTSVEIFEQQSPQIWAPAGNDHPSEGARQVALVVARAS